MRVSEIHLYPVKAMAGVRLDHWGFAEDGLVGDRGWALVDADGRLGTGKDTTRFRRYDAIFGWSARPARGGQTPHVTCEAAGLGWTAADDPRVTEALSAATGADVRLVPLARTPFPGDERGFQDDSPVSLVGTATLAALGELLGTGPVDARHFRANLVVETDEPYVEDSWVGADVAIGGARFAVSKQVTRCRMIDIAQADVDALPGLLKATGARGAKAAVYLRPAGAGTLAVGDEVTPA